MVWIWFEQSKSCKLSIAMGQDLHTLPAAQRPSILHNCTNRFAINRFEKWAAKKLTIDNTWSIQFLIIYMCYKLLGVEGIRFDQDSFKQSFQLLVHLFGWHDLYNMFPVDPGA